MWSAINKVLLDQELPALLQFIPCNIHVVHNAFHAGVNAYGERCEELAIDLFYWLKSSPSCREDYIHVLNDLGLDDELFIPALDRIVKNWEAIRIYFLEESLKLATQEKAFKASQGNEQYKRICRKLQDRFLTAQLAFLLSMEPIFKRSLCFFQSEGPLVHLLCYEMWSNKTKQAIQVGYANRIIYSHILSVRLI